MTPHDLKNSVWQLAVQGKLVEQCPEEGTGEDLFQQIQAEKQALIKTGKIKKGKPLPEIAEDEKPFDLPDGWRWARLETLCSLITDGTHKTPSYTTNGIRFLSVKDISGGYFDLSNTKFISENEHAQLTQRCKPENGDVLICRIGTLGKALAIDIDLEFSIFVSLGLIKPIEKELAKYIETVINSGYGFAWIQKVKVGGGTHTFKINLDDLRMFPIPLPPLAEQKRIVAKLEEILPLIDRYEAAWNKLEAFNKRFPGDMQKSILQLAIQGKLVEQRPGEGTGEDLFQQIRAEKQALIKAGKLKKEKPLADITEEEIPFCIPNNWKWCRLNDVSLMIGDIDHKMPPTVEKNGVPYISPLNFTKDGGINYESAKQISYSDYLQLGKKCTPARNDIIFPRYGTIGVVRIVETDLPFLVSYSCCTIKNFSDSFMNHRYIFYVLKSRLVQDEINRYINKTTQPNVGLQSIKQFLFPLPPLTEQNRIVAKLEEILPLCDRLK